MMTVITRVALKEGTEPEWDQAMQDRLNAAHERPGWVAGQLVMPVESLNERMIIGTWKTRADWEAWHNDEAFRETRERLEGLQEKPNETTWHEVIVEAQGDSA